MHDDGYAHADEETLVDLANQGRPEALGELYRRHRSAARRFAVSLTGCRHTAEDLVAEGFAKVWVRLQGGTRPRTFLAYLLTTVRHLHVDQHRRRDQVSYEDLRELAENDPRWVEEGPESAVLDRVVLERAMGRLCTSHQEFLRWSLIEGRPTREISRLLGMDPNAAGSLAYRARRALRTAYLECSSGGPAEPAADGARR
jgi:RNA polymerase sigma factor (sigma-70 family)